MRNVLFVSKNLLGDALYACVAMKAFYEKNKKDVAVSLLTTKDYVSPVYAHCGIPWRQIHYSDTTSVASIMKRQFTRVLELQAGAAGEIANRDHCHIATGFARVIGFTLDVESVHTPHGVMQNVTPVFNPPPEELPADKKNLILFSPFSRSCTSQEKGADGNLLGKPPNKMLPWSKWLPILAYLRTFGYKVKMLGAREDEAPAELGIAENDYLTGVPITHLANVMKEAKLLVTVDNGMGHLAATQNTPYVLLYPQCLGLHFIVPWGCRSCIPIHIDPANVETLKLVKVVSAAVTHLNAMGARLQ